MIINTEWGAFGDNGCLNFLRTQFDREIDENSINPGRQIFEKMISGMYMGEIARLIMEKLANDGLLFHGQWSAELNERNSFPTKYVSEIERDLMEEDQTFVNTFNILEDLGIEGITPQDCHNVALICQAVSTRAAQLCASAIAVLINRMQKPSSTVGVDGSVYRFHPSFKSLLDENIKKLIDPALKFRLRLSEDGSGRGAALVAAVAHRVDRERRKQQNANSNLHIAQ